MHHHPSCCTPWGSGYNCCARVLFVTRCFRLCPMISLLMLLGHFIIERTPWIGIDWASPLLVQQSSKWCCSHWSFLLKCEKESNSISHSYVRESLWPRQVLLFQQGYFKQDFYKQRLSQEAVRCHSSSLAYILLYIPAAPLKVKWKNINSTTIPQILFLFCGLENVIWKKSLIHPPWHNKCTLDARSVPYEDLSYGGNPNC